MILRFGLAGILLIGGGYWVSAQPPVESTSATDAKVKIHNSRKIILFGHRRVNRRVNVQTHSTEHSGHALPKHRSQQFRQGKNVFRKQNHFARKDSPRSRSRVSRKPSV